MIKSEVAQAIFGSELSRLKKEGQDKLAEITGQSTHRNVQGPDGKTYELDIHVSDTPTPGWLLVLFALAVDLQCAGYKVVVGPNGESVHIE